MKKNKNKTKIILIVSVAMVATIATYSVLSKLNSQISAQNKLIDMMQSTQGSLKTEGNYSYAVAIRDLKAGEIVSNNDIEFRTFSTENSDAFLNREEIVDKVLLSDIKANEVFTSANIPKVSTENLQVRKGYRALTFPSATFSGKSENMVIGTLVDIYSSIGEDSWHLDGVRIVSFSDDEASQEPEAGAPTPKEGTSAEPIKEKHADITKSKTITFEVPANNIADFISNASRGKMVLVERNQGEVVKKRPAKSTTKTANYGSSGNYGSSSLPNLPSTPTIDNLDSQSSSALPMPITPTVAPIEIEIIKAGEKTTVSF